MTLAVATGTKTFSETLMNSYSAALLGAYDWSCGPVFPFQVSSSGEWVGYILHTSNVLRYSLTRGSDTVTIVINGVTVKTITTGGLQSGTVDLATAAPGLVIGTVYTLVVNDVSVVWWIGETKTINYTAPPTFADTNVLTAANLNTLRAAILECQSALAWPLPPCPICDVEDHSGGSNDYLTLYKFSFFHVHDTLRYRYRHHARGYPAETKIYLNGTLVYKHSGDEDWMTGTIDVSALGLTKGTIYYGYVTVEPDGTKRTVSTEGHFMRLTQESAVACAPPPIWAQGGANISAANLTKYGTIIDSIHPAAAAPTLPLYYEQPGVMSTATHKYYLQHRRKWLRYVRKTTGSNTVEICYGPNLKTKADLPGAAGNSSYDLSQIPGLVVGQWYSIDDVEYAQEWSSSQP